MFFVGSFDCKVYDVLTKLLNLILMDKLEVNTKHCAFWRQI